jgi:hypothetical protein
VLPTASTWPEQSLDGFEEHGRFPEIKLAKNSLLRCSPANGSAHLAASAVLEGLEGLRTQVMLVIILVKA